MANPLAENTPERAINLCMASLQQLLHYARTHPLRGKTSVYGLEVRLGTVRPSRDNLDELRFIPGVTVDMFNKGVSEFQMYDAWEGSACGVCEQQQDTLYQTDREVVCSTLRWRDASSNKARGNRPVLVKAPSFPAFRLVALHKTQHPDSGCR